MYPVTDLYKDKINKDGREFTCDIRIEHSQGTLNLTDEDLSMGSLTYTEATQSGDEYTIGSTVASDISFTIFKKPEYENIQFMGATVFATIGLLTVEATDAHFIQPSQPSKMQGFEDVWEYVPLGRFNIDVVDKSDSTIQIKAIDNMINFDKSYNLSNLKYPSTLQQIYVNICNVADVPMGSIDFPNKDYIVTNRPSDDLTLRDILGYVAELSGTFAKCTRTGSVELRWYEPTDLELSPEHRYDFTPSDDVIQITGILATVKGEEEEDDVTYISGSEGYTIDLTENALLQGDYETALPNIYNNVKDTIFTPYSSNSKGNPALQAGDIIKQVDKNGKEYITLITKSVYKYKGKSTLEGKGLPQISKGYKGSTNRKLAEIKHKVDVEIGDKLTTLEEQQLQATELIANMLGGHAIVTNDAFYIADNPNLDLAVKVWKWGIGGFGYSSTGVNGIYTTAITAEGSIVSELVSAGIVSADMIYAGTLESQNGNSSINLDTGVLKLGGNDNSPLLYFNGSDSLIFGTDVKLTWNQIDDKPYIPTVPNYITSTKITQTTIESPIISGGIITGSEVYAGGYGDVDGTITIKDATNNVTAILGRDGITSKGNKPITVVDVNPEEHRYGYITSTTRRARLSNDALIFDMATDGRNFSTIASYGTSVIRLPDGGIFEIGQSRSGLRIDADLQWGDGHANFTTDGFGHTFDKKVTVKTGGLEVRGGLQVTGSITGITIDDLPTGTTSSTVALGNHSHNREYIGVPSGNQSLAFQANLNIYNTEIIIRDMSGTRLGAIPIV